MPIAKAGNPVTIVRSLSRREIISGALAAPLSFGSLEAGSALAAGLQAGSEKPWPLWAVRKSGRIVYLSAQTPPRPTAWSDPRIENLIESCGVIWTETKSVWRGNPNVLVRQYGLNLEHPLSSSLAGHDYADVRKAAEIVKVPLDSLESMRPWLAASEIESAFFRERGLKEQATAERVLLSRIGSGQIRHMSEFAAQDDVIKFMGEMSVEEDIQFLQYTIKQVLSGIEASERIYSAWANGDRKPAAEFVAEMKRSQPGVYQKHVVIRNTNWLSRFDQMQKEAKPSLVIVGIYHMAGPDSLVEYLKQDGWIVDYLS